MIKIKFRQISGQLDISTGYTFFYGNAFLNINEAIKKYNELLMYRLECERIIDAQFAYWSAHR